MAAPTSQYGSLDHPLPLPTSMPALTATNESFRLVGGSPPLSSPGTGSCNPQRAVLTRWVVFLPSPVPAQTTAAIHPLPTRRRRLQAPTSQCDSLDGPLPLPASMPALTTTNEPFRLVGGSPPSSLARPGPNDHLFPPPLLVPGPLPPPSLVPGPNDPPRVFTTRWWVSSLLPRSSRPKRPPTSRLTRWCASFPLPCSSQAQTTTNESFDSLVGPLPPPSLVPGPNDHQRVFMTRWWVSPPLPRSSLPMQPPTSHCGSLGGFSPLPCSSLAQTTTNES